MPAIKFLLGIAWLILVIGLFLDHRRIHGRFATVEDFRNAIFNCIKSHEGIIFIATVFYIGCLTGLLVVLASG